MNRRQWGRKMTREPLYQKDDPMRATLKAFLLATCALAPALLAANARAADPAPVHITVIADLDDDLYDARAGRGGVDATRMAVADFGGTVLGRPIVVDSLNDHNKAAEAPGLATQAYDAGADLLMDVQNSPIAAAVSKVATDRHKLAISTGSGNPTLTRGGLQPLFLSLLVRWTGARDHHRQLSDAAAAWQALGHGRRG